MIASSYRSRRSAAGCTGDVCGSGRVLVLPVTPEITASFVAATEAAPAYRAGRVGPGLWALVSGGGAALTLGPGLGR